MLSEGSALGAEIDTVALDDVVGEVTYSTGKFVHLLVQGRDLLGVAVSVEGTATANGNGLVVDVADSLRDVDGALDAVGGFAIFHGLTLVGVA